MNERHKYLKKDCEKCGDKLFVLLMEICEGCDKRLCIRCTREHECTEEFLKAEDKDD